jgi:hypothetical protein
MENQNHSNHNVVSLAQFRKHQAEQKSKHRTPKAQKGSENPIIISHAQGKVSTNTQGEFSDRLGRIKASLERINSLMSDLRKVSQDMKTASAPAMDRRK